jgi:hypothetical protein
MEMMTSASLSEGSGNRLDEILSRLVGHVDRLAIIEEMTRANANRILGHEPEAHSVEKMPERGVPDGTLSQIDDMLMQLTRSLDKLDDHARRFNRL